MVGFVREVDMLYYFSVYPYRKLRTGIISRLRELSYDVYKCASVRVAPWAMNYEILQPLELEFPRTVSIRVCRDKSRVFQDTPKLSIGKSSGMYAQIQVCFGVRVNVVAVLFDQVPVVTQLPCGVRFRRGY